MYGAPYTALLLNSVQGSVKVWAPLILWDSLAFGLGLIGFGLGLMIFFMKRVPGLTIAICNKITVLKLKYSLSILKHNERLKEKCSFNNNLFNSSWP